MVQKQKYIWLDGKMMNWDEANVHILTHSLHYGLGAFEGLRCYQCQDGRSAIFRLEDHIDRLFQSCHIGQMKIPFTPKELCDATVELLHLNNLAECYIRPLVFVGDGIMGLNPGKNPIRVSLIAWPWGSYLGDEGMQKGIRLKTSSFRRHAVDISMVRAKICGYYVNSIMAKREALELGYDEGILLDKEGYICEASGENVFIVRKGKILTSQLTSVLDGFTRDTVICLAKQLGFEIGEARLTRDDLYIADELFLTGTAAEVTPVREMDSRLIGTGQRGPITEKLQSAYFKLVRGEAGPEFDRWLTYL